MWKIDNFEHLFNLLFLCLELVESKSSPCDQAYRKKSDFLFLPMAALSPVASEPGTLASV